MPDPRIKILQKISLRKKKQQNKEDIKNFVEIIDQIIESKIISEEDTSINKINSDLSRYQDQLKEFNIQQKSYKLQLETKDKKMIERMKKLKNIYDVKTNIIKSKFNNLNVEKAEIAMSVLKLKLKKTKILHSLANIITDSCPICTEILLKEDFVFLPCFHFVCPLCYIKLDSECTNICKCPMCRFEYDVNNVPAKNLQTQKIIEMV